VRTPWRRKRRSSLKSALFKLKMLGLMTLLIYGLRSMLMKIKKWMKKVPQRKSLCVNASRKIRRKLRKLM